MKWMMLNINSTADDNNNKVNNTIEEEKGNQ